MRWIKHLLMTHWWVRRRFNGAALHAIEDAITQAELGHQGELRFVVETALTAGDLWHRKTSRQRAAEVFAELGVWDTAANNGVLLYVLFAEHAVEIVADRGYRDVVAAESWQRICTDVSVHFKSNDYQAGSLAGISAIATLMQRHFPGDDAAHNELPNRPTLI